MHCSHKSVSFLAVPETLARISEGNLDLKKHLENVFKFNFLKQMFFFHIRPQMATKKLSIHYRLCDSRNKKKVSATLFPQLARHVNTSGHY